MWESLLQKYWKTGDRIDFTACMKPHIGSHNPRAFEREKEKKRDLTRQLCIHFDLFMYSCTWPSDVGLNSPLIPSISSLNALVMVSSLIWFFFLHLGHIAVCILVVMDFIFSILLTVGSFLITKNMWRHWNYSNFGWTIDTECALHMKFQQWTLLDVLVSQFHEQICWIHKNSISFLLSII